MFIYSLFCIFAVCSLEIDFDLFKVFVVGTSYNDFDSPKVFAVGTSYIDFDSKLKMPSSWHFIYASHICFDHDAPRSLAYTS